uniref:Putative cullin n=1 Tax=Trypanosoma congolense (strain IL3000) TaxID=1068625 RepID=G0USB9_TRYCI|nr:putative cullin [Trypanosoma congolense IL3000]
MEHSNESALLPKAGITELPKSEPTVDAVWNRLEEYLTQTATIIRSGSGEMEERLQGARHHMRWYADVYYVCRGHPGNFCEVYRRLALFVLKDLEENVLVHIVAAAKAMCSSPRPCDNDTTSNGRENKISSSLSESTSLCSEFVRQFKLFTLFRRVVQSCFGYLDHFYTGKFHLDSVSIMCFKIFYVVVYGPVRNQLVVDVIKLADEARRVNEISGGGPPPALCAAIGEFLAVVSEIIKTVRNSSTTCAGASFTCSGAALRKGTGADDAWKNVSSSGNDCASSSDYLENDESQSCLFEYARQLRKRIESTTLLEYLAGTQHFTGASYPSAAGGNYKGKSNSYRGAGTGAAAVAASEAAQRARLFIVNLSQPLPTLILNHFGTRYLSAMENYYRRERAVRLATPNGKRRYWCWVQRCRELEGSLLRDMDVPFFSEILFGKLRSVLLLETYREVILDKKFGFRVQLDQWIRSGHSHRRHLRKKLVTLEANSDRMRLLTPPPSPEASSSVSAKSGDSGKEGCNCSNLRLLTDEDDLVNQDRNEFLSSLGIVVTTFTSTGNGEWTELLCSELATKIVCDASSLLVELASMEETYYRTHPQEERQCKHEEDTAFRNDLSTAVVGGLVGMAMQYNALVREQFNGFPSLQLAVLDAFREVLCCERWERNIPDTTPTEGDDGGNVLPTMSAPNLNYQLFSFRGRQLTEEARSALRKMIATQGKCITPLSKLFSHYCNNLCRREKENGVAEVISDASETFVGCGESVVDSNLLAVVHHVAGLASFLGDKDVFLEEYKLLLASRLRSIFFHGPSSPYRGVEFESALLKELREAFGQNFNRSLDRMLRDHDLSDGMVNAFRKTQDFRELRSKINVHVVTAVHWPTYVTRPFAPCTSLEAAAEAFRSYYTSVHPQRRLLWMHAHGTAVLEAEFPRGTKEIVAGMVQANILILVSDAYNAARRAQDDQERRGETAIGSRKHFLTVEEIASAMGMTFEALQIHLEQLVQNGSCNLLTRAIATPHVPHAQADESPSPAPGDGYTLNISFTHTMRKLELPAPRLHANQRVAESTQRFQVDAAAVRVMKKHSSLRYQKLISEVKRELSRLFAPSEHLVKMRIENLLARDILRRCETDPEALEYVT